MEIIGKEEFEAAKNMAPTLRDDAKQKMFSPHDIDNLLREMQSPVKFQKELAVKIKMFLDHQIETEMSNKGILSDHTRRWVESYGKMLDKIQSAIYGDKSVNLHLHKVSHSDISTKIRDSLNEVNKIKDSEV